MNKFISLNRAVPLGMAFFMPDLAFGLLSLSARKNKSREFPTHTGPKGKPLQSPLGDFEVNSLVAPESVHLQMKTDDINMFDGWIMAIGKCVYRLIFIDIYRFQWGFVQVTIGTL